MDSFLCGAAAGLVETMICHPLDTIKTRRQTRPATIPEIIGGVWRSYGGMGFYKGLAPVLVAVVLKNAVRFGVYDAVVRGMGTSAFVAGWVAGTVEAVMVVNPTDILKIRFQMHSMRTPDTGIGNRPPTLFSILREEKWRLFSRGVGFTILRQSVNQSTNFQVHHILVNEYGWSTTTAGFVSGAVGPILNHPFDVIKTHLQSGLWRPNLGIRTILGEIHSAHGIRGFYRGLGPRLLRIMPGQAITFTVYDTLLRSWRAAPETAV